MAKENRPNRGSGLITATVLVAGVAGIFGALKYRPVVEVTSLNPAPISVAVSVVEDVYDSVVGDVVENDARPRGYEILGQYIYGEGANQLEITREAIGQVIKNRVGRKGYKDSLEGVIKSDARFTCVGSKKNKNWAQATGELPRNEYEEMIYQRCLNDSADVLNGKDLGYENQDKWIAYFDSSTNYEKVCKLDSAYWETLRPDVSIGDITLCVPLE